MTRQRQGCKEREREERGESETRMTSYDKDATREQRECREKVKIVTKGVRSEK